MKLAILIINDPQKLGLTALMEILNEKYDFTFQSKNSMVHQSLTDETEFLSFLGGEIEDGYEEEELQHIHQILKSPCFYYMEFYRFSFFKEIVRYLNNRFILMVDDDRGHIYDASTFLKLENW